MKTLLLAITLLGATLTVDAQTNDTTFTASQVRRIVYVVDSLTKENARLLSLDKVNNELLKQKDESIDMISAIGIQYEVIIGRQQQQIEILEASLETCQENNTKLKFRKGFKTWFLAGLATGVTSALIIK